MAPRKRHLKEIDAVNGEGSKAKKPRKVFQLPLPKRNDVRGSLFVVGDGDMGQLGLGDAKKKCKKPTPLSSINDIVDLKTGGMHSVVLTSDGRVYTFGCNDEGALGRDISEEGSDFIPIEVKLPGKAVRISAGDSHSACLLEDGRVFAWGDFRDSNGSMGLTPDGKQPFPIEIINEVCCDISSGNDHLVMLTCKGKVFTMGYAEQGQLGRIASRSASGGRSGTRILLTPRAIFCKNKCFDAIWTTDFCTFLRDSKSGIIYGCGLNNYKQLGHYKEEDTVHTPVEIKDFNNAKQIVGGDHHTIVLKSNRSCYAIGRYHYGRLGLGKHDVAAITELQQIKTLNGKNVEFVASRGSASFAITSDGKLYAWGMGDSYKLGTGKEEDVFEPVCVQSEQTQDKRFINVGTGSFHSLFLVKAEKQSENIAAEKKSASLKKTIAEKAIKDA